MPDLQCALTATSTDGNMKEMTRREVLQGFFSKDTLKEAYGAWHHFNKEVDNASKLTGDAAVLEIARKLKKKTSKLDLLDLIERRDK